MEVKAALDRARSWLEAARNPDGSWGYRPGLPGMGEPTLLAAAAGLSPGLDWLRTSELGWSQLLLPVALSRTAGTEPLRQQAVERILALEGNRYPTAGSYDGDLVGWPWVDGTFSWVEPTAWAILSLRSAGKGDHPRVVQGLKVLADRQCADGGWNAGTPDILGVQLHGYLDTTGLVLMALPQGHSSVKAALSFLSGVRQRPSPLNLSLAVLALSAHEADLQALVPLLLSLQQPDGGFAHRSDRTALAASALAVAAGEGSPLVI